MTKIIYSGYRFPPEVIKQVVWLYLQFSLSLRDVEDLLPERGIVILLHGASETRPGACAVSTK
jgi:transposase-like protein